MPCCLLALAGCFSGWEAAPSPDAGSVKIVITAPQSFTRQLAFSEVEVSLTNGVTVLSQKALLQNGSAEVGFPRVLVGYWSVTANIKDDAGDVVYTGTTRLPVYKGQEASVNITLMPASGCVDFYADISNVPSQERVYKVKLYKDSTNLRSQVDIIRDPSSMVVHTVLTGIPPKVYDMMIKLYTPEGDVLYESPWTSVEVRPGKTTVINWDFSSGSAAIAVDYDSVPPAPAGLGCTVLQEAVNLSWQAPVVEENDLAGYVVYRRELPFDGYRELTRTGLETSYRDTEVRVGSSYAYVVTALDLSGNESLRSNEVTAAIAAPATP
ncbi:MAG TPA: fibronectin type III domain-containing protein [Firmicutes bacterium]|nr:fibronectin type III domain-containing protein [Bacillota bacterium]